MTVVGYIAIAAAAIIGVAHMIKIVKNRALCSGKKYSIITVVPISGHIEDAELMMRHMMSCQEGKGICREDILIIVDMGLDAQTREICERFSKKEERLIVCDDYQIGHLIQQGVLQAKTYIADGVIDKNEKKDK